MFVIYGKDQASCQSRVSDLRLYLSLRDNEEQPQVLHDLAYTLSEHRTVMPWMVACRSVDVLGLQEALESGKPATARVPSQPPRLGIVFNGQGAQWHAMGRELIHRYDVFRASIEQMGVHIREMGATWSLMGLCSAALPCLSYLVRRMRMLTLGPHQTSSRTCSCATRCSAAACASTGPFTPITWRPSRPSIWISFASC